MKTEITDAVGVTMAGPDEPALAKAKARDHDGTAYLTYSDAERAAGRHPLNFEDWSEGQMPVDHKTRMQDPTYRAEIAQLGRMRAGSVGDVAQRQAGILPTGGIKVSDAMVHRALTELIRHENPLGASAMRATLEAALRG